MSNPLTTNLAADGVRLNYGECKICGENFLRGETAIQLSTLYFHTAQGFEEITEASREAVHWSCVTPEWLDKFVEQTKHIINT